MADEARDQPSPLVALAALAPDAAFGAARMFQRATFGAISRGVRVSGAVANVVLDTPPVRGSLALLQPQVRSLAARGAAIRHNDEEQVKSFLGRIEPVVSSALLMVVDLLPIDAILARIDVNAIIGQVDVDALIQRVDVPKLVTDGLENIELGDLIADSTTNIAADTRDSVRVQAIRADGGLAGLIDRILRRRGERDLVVPDYQWRGVT